MKNVDAVIGAGPAAESAAESAADSPRRRLESLLRKRLERRTVYPSSATQWRFWTLNRVGGGDSYHVPVIIRLRGSLDVDAILSALRDVVRRHEILRTVLVPLADGGVGQSVLPEFVPVVPVTDLRCEADVERELENRLRAMSTAPFALDREPAIRAALFRTADDVHFLCVVMHHAVTDGWSLAVMAGEIVAQYGSHLTRGSPLPAAPLAIQYADFARWQRERLESGGYAAAATFWEEQFRELPEPLGLPADRPRPMGLLRGARVPIHIDAGLAAALRELGQRQGATPYMVLLAAWASFLGRLAGQRDVVVGSPFAGRTRPELEELIGCFVNTLAMRCRWHEGHSFEQVLNAVRNLAIDAYAHQDYPFDRVVEALTLPREYGSSPLFRVMFAYQNIRRPNLDLPGIDVEILDRTNDTAKFDISFTIHEATDGSLDGIWEYAADIYHHDSIAEWVDMFQRWIRLLVELPTTPIDTLDWILPTQDRLLDQWAAGPVSNEVPGTTLDRVFASVVAKHPEAVAIDDGSVCILYRDLLAAADRVAAGLSAAGVVAGDIVAIQGQRSWRWIAGMIGVLRAGGIYLPLDPDNPPEHTAFVLDDALPRVFLHDTDSAPNPDGVRVMALQDLLRDTAASVPADHHRTGNDLASIMYTSGSSGRPKGVRILHRGIANFATHPSVLDPNLVRRRGGLRMAHLSNLAFDASTMEIWLPLFIGGTVVIFSYEEFLDPVRLPKAIVDRDVGVAFMTSSYVNRLGQIKPGLFAGFSQLIFGGSVILPESLTAIREACPHLMLTNIYGPTEITVACTFHPVALVASDGGAIPIGRPIQNTRVEVLDTVGRRQPPGVAGEMVVCGFGVAGGYLGRPEETALRFVSMEGEPGYRTGDLARWNRLGQLEFLGRKDRQLKVRGFRIEPSEIENRCLAFDGVEEATVKLVVAGDSELLVAYVATCNGDDGDLPRRLRDFLRSQLPPSMVPHIVVPLERLPKLSSGKVDSVALPAPTEAHRGVSTVSPRGDTEIALAAIWCDLIGVDRIGAFDAFFDIGGNSLSALRMVLRIRETFGVEFPLKSVWMYPTLEGIAARIDEFIAAGRLGAINPIAARPLESAPLALSQEAIWLAEKILPGSINYSIGVGARIHGELDHDALRGALAMVARRHAILRSRIVTHDGKPVIEPLDDNTADWTEEDLSSLPKDLRLERAAVIAARTLDTPFDLTRGPLMRGSLVRLGPGESLFHLVFHHLAIDGWSLSIASAELGFAYAALTRGSPLPAAPLAIQYADFARWQRERLESGGYAAAATFWEEQFRELPEPLGLPADRPRPMGLLRGARVPIHIDAGLAAALRELGQRQGATPYMVLLAAWASFLGRLAGQRDVVVGSPFAGRTRPELEELIGCFVNTLAMRCRWHEGHSFEQVLNAVRNLAIDAYAHQDYPFDRVVEALTLPREYGSSPLFRVMFAYQNIRRPNLDLPGIDVEILDRTNDTAKFDISFTIHEATDGSLDGIWEYAADIYHHDSIAEWVDMFQRWIRLLVELPTTPIDTLDWILPTQDRLLHQWAAANHDHDGAIPSVLDDRGSLQPVGVIGHLHLADRVSNGAMAQTRPSGFSARWTREGRLEILGRLDRCLRLRGFRIHPEEIEQALCDASGATVAHIRVEQDGAGERLVARLVIDAPSVPAHEIRAILRQRFPAYKVPARIEIDGERDPATAVPVGADGSPYVTAPMIPVICACWARALALPSVSPNDDFFDLGGHSLLAIQVAAGLTTELAVDVGPIDIFHAPTAASLALRLCRNATELQTTSPPIAVPPAANPRGNRYLVLVERPLDELIISGTLAPVDSLAIGYLPPVPRRLLDLARASDAVGQFLARPFVSHTIDNEIGRVACIILPMTAGDLYSRPEDLHRHLVDACRLGRRLGADRGSLTGLVPSATAGGRSVQRALDEAGIAVRVTSGHATTAAAVLANITTLADAVGRRLDMERMAFLGLGSIGFATLRLMIAIGTQPASLLLVDVRAKEAHLHDTASRLREWGFHGRVEVVISNGPAPDQVYDCTFVVGATSLPDVLDPARLRPGTLVVDDSGPHCFPVREAIDRMQYESDVILVEGGTLRTRTPSVQHRYAPAAFAAHFSALGGLDASTHDPFRITGCVLAGLVSGGDHRPPLVLGPPSVEELVGHHAYLATSGIRAASLHCQHHEVSVRTLELFRHRQQEGWNHTGDR